MWDGWCLEQPQLTLTFHTFLRRLLLLYNFSLLTFLVQFSFFPTWDDSARPSAGNCLSFLFVVVCVNDDWKSLMKPDNCVIKTDAHATEVESTRWFKYDRDCLHSCLHTNHPGHIWTTLYKQEREFCMCHNPSNTSTLASKYHFQ